MTKFDIEITSDTVCPWCYVGKKKLEAGIDLYRKANPSANDTFNVTWMPFQLDPSSPVAGIDKQQYYEKRFGDPARISAMHERLAGVGKEHGIDFRFGGRTGNTRNSHRLLNLALSKGDAVQNKVVEQLFAGYFEQEKDITSPEFLQQAALNAGLDREEVKALFESDSRGPEVDKELLEARKKMITGVPNFVLNQKYEIQGAQDAEGFRRVFEKIKELEG